MRYTTKHILAAVFLFGILLASVVWIANGMGSGADAAKRVACRRNLRLIWSRLERFIEEHGELPRDSDLGFSIAALHDGMDVSQWECPCSSGQMDGVSQGGYLVLSHLELSQLATGSTRIPIVCDVIGNHGSDGTAIVNVLFSTGETGTFGGDYQKCRTWISTHFNSKPRNVISIDDRKSETESPQPKRQEPGR